MPQQKTKIKYRKGFKKWADEKVVEIRQQMGLYPSSPLCAFDLCKFLKVSVQTPLDIQNFPKELSDELLGNGASSWSAATIPLSNGKYLIIHNPTHSEARQQSNLMHEIAHILCEHKVSEEIENTGLSGFLRNFDEQHENEAEWLGACLQLPRPALFYSLKKGLTIQEIAQRYNCSEQMARYRINITGLKNRLKII